MSSKEETLVSALANIIHLNANADKHRHEETQGCYYCETQRIAEKALAEFKKGE